MPSDIICYSAFPSSCNFRLQQRQPCEPIREQNLNPAIWLDGTGLALATGCCKSLEKRCIWHLTALVISTFWLVLFKLRSCERCRDFYVDFLFQWNKNFWQICTCTASVGKKKNIYTWYQEWEKWVQMSLQAWPNHTFWLVLFKLRFRIADKRLAIHSIGLSPVLPFSGRGRGSAHLITTQRSSVGLYWMPLNTLKNSTIGAYGKAANGIRTRK